MRFSRVRWASQTAEGVPAERMVCSAVFDPPQKCVERPIAVLLCAAGPCFTGAAACGNEHHAMRALDSILDNPSDVGRWACGECDLW